jgi:hypothetical protein
MTHQGKAVQVKHVDESRQIVCKRVVVITMAGLVGAAVPSPVVGDAAQTAIDHCDHLVLPHP